jgi:hypothetical protein
MGAVLRVYAVDLERFRSMLGSGEEAFCAKVLRAIPNAAERRGLAKSPDLVKDWKRSVSGLVLGASGEALAANEPFDRSSVAKAGPGLALAFASILEGFAEAGLGGVLSGEVPGELRRRPLFGLDSDVDLVRWGALRRNDPAPSPALLLAIQGKGLDAVGLSGSAWTD